MYKMVFSNTKTCFLFFVIYHVYTITIVFFPLGTSNYGSLTNVELNPNYMFTNPPYSSTMDSSDIVELPGELR